MSCIDVVKSSTSPWGCEGDPAEPSATGGVDADVTALDPDCVDVHSALVAQYSQNCGAASLEYNSPHFPNERLVETPCCKNPKLSWRPESPLSLIPLGCTSLEFWPYTFCNLSPTRRYTVLDLQSIRGFSVSNQSFPNITLIPSISGIEVKLTRH